MWGTRSSIVQNSEDKVNMLLDTEIGAVHSDHGIFCVWRVLSHNPSGYPCTEAPQGMEISGCTSSIGAVVEQSHQRVRLSSFSVEGVVWLKKMSQEVWSLIAVKGVLDTLYPWPSVATCAPPPVCDSWQVQCTQWALSLGMQAVNSWLFLKSRWQLPSPLFPNLYMTRSPCWG